MNNLAHIAWAIPVLTTVLVYLTAVVDAVAIGFVDTAGSGLRNSRGSMVCFSNRLAACIIGQERL